MLQFGNIWPERVKQFVRFQKAVGQPLVHRNSLLKLLEKSLSHNNLSVSLSLEEIRIQRDSNNTEHNLRSGFPQSIGTVKESLNRLNLSLCLISIAAHFFLRCPRIAFCSGASRRGAPVVSIFYLFSEPNGIFARIY